MTKKPWRAGKDLSAVVENMEIGTGQRGDGRHAFVTREELVGLKLAKRRAANSGYQLNPGIDQDWTTPAPEFPVRPLNFKATGGFGSVLLEWDAANYRGHSLTEIWRGTEDDIADAVLVATTPGQVYGDPVDPGWSGFYWIRFVNSAGVQGSWNDVKGTGAKTQVGIQAVVDQIREEAANSPVIDELRKEIKDARKRAVEDASLQTTEVVGSLREETLKTIGDVETRITSLDETTGKSLNDVDKRLNKLDNEGSEAFLAMWSKKAGVDGITAGIGIVAGKDSSGKPISQVAISASQLFVFDPNDANKKAYPFAVSGGKVVIPKAMIYDAVIETLVSRKVVADEVKAGISITSPIIRSAFIQNGNFQVNSQGDMQIGDWFSVTIQGKLTARNADISGNVNANSGTLNNVRINENCLILGKLSANQIEGDIVKTVGKAFPRRYMGNVSVPEGTVTVRIYDNQPFDRQIVIPPVIFRGEDHVRGSTGANGSENYSTSYCRLTVRKNGTEIYNQRADNNTLIYSDVIDMPAGSGHMTLEFSVSSTTLEFGNTVISNLLVLVMKKSTAGITIS